MRLFKRISSAVLTSVDEVVSRVENHDAVVDSLLRELQESAAQAKVRLSRVQKDGVTMQNRLKQLQQTEQQWTDRARQVAASEESKALACLQRRKHCQEQVTGLQTALQQHTVMEQKLRDQVQQIEQRCQEVRQQRHLLQSRHAVADASRVIGSLQGAGAHDIDTAFDRWEIAIARTELMTDSPLDLGDPLESEFVRQEDEQYLRAELHNLLNAAEVDDEQQ